MDDDDDDADGDDDDDAGDHDSNHDRPPLRGLFPLCHCLLNQPDQKVSLSGEFFYHVIVIDIVIVIVPY